MNSYPSSNDTIIGSQTLPPLFCRCCRSVQTSCVNVERCWESLLQKGSIGILKLTVTKILSKTPSTKKEHLVKEFLDQVFPLRVFLVCPKSPTFFLQKRGFISSPSRIHIFLLPVKSKGFSILISLNILWFDEEPIHLINIPLLVK